MIEFKMGKGVKSFMSVNGNGPDIVAECVVAEISLAEVVASVQGISVEAALLFLYQFSAKNLNDIGMHGGEIIKD